MSVLLRRKSRVVRIGAVRIGGNFPVAIQSMAKTKTADIAATVRQIGRLQQAGCEIVRVAIKDRADAQALRTIRKNISLPLVADIHFDWTLAMEAIEAGADKIRLNPGNIDKKAQVREVCAAAKLAKIPIRVGLNSGSVGKGRDQVSLMVEKCRQYLRLMEGFDFRDIVVSLKAQNPLDTVRAYRRMSRLCDYPFHLGVTATGLPEEGLLKSSVAIGSLLLDGIGDTIRISLTDKPEREVTAARTLLNSLGVRKFKPSIISCPTCGRCEVDLIRIVQDLEEKLKRLRFDAGRLPGPIAVMGCVVNGPGEARQADIGIAFGRHEGLLFRKGRPIRKVAPERAVDVLIAELCRHS